MANFFEALIPISFFIGIFWVIYSYRKFAHREKMYMLESGLAGEELFQKKEYKYNFWLFRLGMLMMAVPLGGYIGDRIISKGDDLTVMGSMIFFAGLFWIAEFFIEKSIIDKSNS